MPPAGSSVSFGVSEGSPQPDRNDRKSHWITESRVTLGGNILKAGALWKKIGLGKHASATKLRTPLPQEPQHRFLPAQAGSFKDRRDANSLDALESVSVEAVIEASLWRYHRLLPVPSDSKRYTMLEKLMRNCLLYTSFWLPMRISFFGQLPCAPRHRTRISTHALPRASLLSPAVPALAEQIHAAAIPRGRLLRRCLGLHRLGRLRDRPRLLAPHCPHLPHCIL